MAVKTETRHTAEFLVWEADPSRRKSITVLSGEDLGAGTVLGEIRFGTAAVDADAGNTGNGTVTNVVPGDDAMVGDYRLEAIDATGDGTFAVFAPNGARLADADGDSSYSSPQISFDVAAGGTGWAVGDEITITIPEGSGKFVQLDLTGTDGRKVAAGVLYGDADASDGDASGVAVVRDATVNAGEITWPDGISSGDKDTAIDELKSLGVLVR